MMIHDDHLTLGDLVATPALAAEVELDRIPELLGEIERLRAVLWARLTIGSNRPRVTDDHLLGIREAAARLATSKDWLYRNSHRLPFTVRLSDRFLRYSAKGIDRWIASRVGRRR
jgi:predicted DNA-binding transcriptional regulator AlpA